MHLNFLIVEVIRRIGIPVFLKGRIIMFTDGKCTSTSIRQDVAMLQSCRANWKPLFQEKTPMIKNDQNKFQSKRKLLSHMIQNWTLTVIENKNFEPVLCIIEPVG